MTSDNSYDGLDTSSSPFDEMWNERTTYEDELDRAYNSDDEMFEEE